MLMCVEKIHSKSIQLELSKQTEMVQVHKPHYLHNESGTVPVYVV